MTLRWGQEPCCVRRQLRYIVSREGILREGAFSSRSEFGSPSKSKTNDYLVDHVAVGRSLSIFLVAVPTGFSCNSMKLAW